MPSPMASSGEVLLLGTFLQVSQRDSLTEAVGRGDTVTMSSEQPEKPSNPL